MLRRQRIYGRAIVVNIAVNVLSNFEIIAGPDLSFTDKAAMELELKEILNDLESLKQSLIDPSHRSPIDKVCLNSC